MTVTAFGPGRVNLIGEHTDYNGGLSLPFAIAQGVTVTAQPRDDGQLRVRAADLDEDDAFAVDAPSRDAGGWRAFVHGAVGELAGEGLRVVGADLEIHGDVPRGSGLSSSAALEVALVLALLEIAGEPEPDRKRLARLCARIENDWVGAETGLLDQIASLLGREDEALRVDFATLDVTTVPCDLRGHRLVTVDSREVHDNASGGYNERRAECAEACRLLGVESLTDADREAAAQLPDPLDRRVRHVLSENARVDEAVGALRDGAMETLGTLLDASHASLRDDYDASTDAVEATVLRLTEAGALGARMVGGGFGGHVLALFPPDATLPDDAVAVHPSAGARLL